eukprot:813550-Prorocentrum_minimum.AAC.2
MKVLQNLIAQATKSAMSAKKERLQGSLLSLGVASVSRGRFCLWESLLSLGVASVSRGRFCL